MEPSEKLLLMIKLPTFNNKALFEQAFTHRSFLNETREKIESNERLEFLGDSILSFIVSDYLYKTYPDFNEGILTNLRSMVVNTKSLANIARELEFGTHLKLSRGEEESHGRENDSILANCFEAYIGALFMDQGIAAVESFLNDTLIHRIKGFVDNKIFKDPKSLFQEFVQGKKQNSPIYRVLHEEGPPHAKIFTVGVFVQDELLGEGVGKSKQEAEEQAAKQALEKMREA
jgi:ribonuclease III